MRIAGGIDLVRTAENADESSSGHDLGRIET